MQKVTSERIKELEDKVEKAEKVLSEVKDICREMRKDVDDPMYG
jgi:uncharacterized coiled-coil protein SlyX